MWLYIGIGAIKDLLYPVNGQLFYQVHNFVTAIVSFARIAFCILIGQWSAHGLHHLQDGNILGSAQCYTISLALDIFIDQLKYNITFLLK